MRYVDKHRSNIHQGSRLSMADPDKKKPDFTDFFAKFADRNPFEHAKTAKELIDKIKKGNDPNGSVENPDKILSFSVIK